MKKKKLAQSSDKIHDEEIIKICIATDEHTSFFFKEKPLNNQRKLAIRNRLQR